MPRILGFFDWIILQQFYVGRVSPVMKFAVILLCILLVSTIAYCGDNICEFRDHVTCPEDCIPTVIIYSGEKVAGHAHSEECGLGWGSNYYAFNISCGEKLQVNRNGPYQLNLWTNHRQDYGFQKKSLCDQYCQGQTEFTNLTYPIVELEIPEEGEMNTEVYYDYLCQTEVTAANLVQVSKDRLRTSISIIDHDNDLERVDMIVTYPDFNRSSMQMTCDIFNCSSEFATHGNGTYVLEFTTRDSRGDVQLYYPDPSSCTYNRRTEKSGLFSDQRYLFEFNITVDPCFGITCFAKCVGDTRYFDGFCSNGICNYTQEVCQDNCFDNSTLRNYFCQEGACVLGDLVPCQVSEYCENGSCIAKKSNDLSCQLEYECASGRCVNFLCCPENMTCCTLQENCANSTYCYYPNKRCQPKQETGFGCESDFQCLSENCNHGVCCKNNQICCTKDQQCGFLSACNLEKSQCNLHISVYLFALAFLIGYAKFSHSAFERINQAIRETCRRLARIERRWLKKYVEFTSRFHHK